MMRWVIVAAIVGFPLALAVAWHLRADADPSPSRIKGASRWTFPGVAALVFIALLVQLAAHWSHPPDSGAKVFAQGSIAVLPFANLSGDPAKRYFSDGIADQLITELSRRKNLRVAART